MDDSPTRGSAAVRIDAPAEVAFTYLTDLTTLPELGPENVRCEFLEPTVRLEIYPGKIEGRRDQLQQGCETTLADLKAALEGR